jgi:cobalt-zinc-cadmium efflux system membrane fusion protein
MKAPYVLLLTFLLISPHFRCLANPTTANLTGQQSQEDQADAANCSHDIAEKRCYIDNPDLRDKGRLWCREHTRYEDRCFLCHPEIRDPKRLYCKEHWLYEDECYICHPEIPPPWEKGKGEQDQKGDEDQKPDQHALGSGGPADAPGQGLYCNEHDLYESECGICHPELLKSLKVGEGLKVRFTSRQSGLKAGVQTGSPEGGVTLPQSSFLARLTYNQNQYGKVTSLAAGVIQRVAVDFGQKVTAGTVLAEIAAPEIADAKAAYLNALSELKLKETGFKRERQMFEKRVSSQQDFDEAEAEYAKALTATETARQMLKNYGLRDRGIDALAQSKKASSVYQIRAPFAGTIVDRMAVVGDVAHTETPMFILADLATMWLEISIPIDHFASVGQGNPVTANFQGLGQRHFEGRIFWVSSAVNETTRMIQARALIENHHGLLKNGMFGEARISGGNQPILGLPDTALQRIDEEDVIFVKHAPDLFEIRKVLTQHGKPGQVGILSGLSHDEKVVLAGTFTVKSEYLKSRLGAGCTH